MSNIQIAIDGPAGAGKSTISKIIAQKLKFVYIDTGAMYRAVGLAALNAGLDTKSESHLKTILDDIKIDIKHTEDEQLIFLNDEDVSKKIRTPEVSVAASNVAVIPSVRIKLVELQRGLAEKNNVVMDGRDIGTYVLPNATVKIFLTASVDERARRRFEELKEKNMDVTFEDVKRDIEYRDKNDSSREFAPLKPAKDSIIIDTTGNELEKSVEILYNTICNALEN